MKEENELKKKRKKRRDHAWLYPRNAWPQLHVKRGIDIRAKQMRTKNE